jgi:CRISPR-associated protein Csd2
MFEHDRSAARGEMSTRGLYVFKHEGELGDAQAHALFDLVQVAQNDPNTPARGFADFTVAAPAAGLLEGFPRVNLERIVG